MLRSYWRAAGAIRLVSIAALGSGLKYFEEDARQQNMLDAKDRDLMSRINPFVQAPTPAPTPQLSKEYIYAGQRLVAVEDAGASAATPADLAVWRPSTGTWWVLGGQGSQSFNAPWGGTGDVPVPGDFDGDGKTDLSVYRPSTGQWWITNSSNQSQYSVQFGTGSDTPAQADYDGDGRTDAAVFRKDTPSAGLSTWYILRSSDGGVTIIPFGIDSDIPTPADFDGDGRADIALYRSSEAKYYHLLSSQNYAAFQQIAFGQAGDRPVPGDYDGDGRADAAVWRGGVYQWHILYSSTGATEGFTFGDPATDVYVQNDYDGDGKVDRAFWRPSNGTWYITQSSRRGQPDEVRSVQFGQAGDIPVPAFYRR